MWSSGPPVLRPLGVGERLDASFKIVGRNFLPMAKAVLVLAIPSGIVEALITTSTALPKATTTNGPFGATTIHYTHSQIWTYAAGLLALVVIIEIATAIATATCYLIVGHSYVGQSVPWRTALRHGAARLPSIAWIILLVFLAIVIPGLPVGLVVGVAAAAHIPALAAAVGFLGGATWLVYAVWFTVGSRLAVPTLMIEEIRGAKALRRSLQLCRGNWWSVFGTEILAWLLVEIFGIVLGIVTLVVGAASNDSTVAGAIAGFFIRTIDVIVVTPFTAAVLVILAIDLRVRKEGFDIELLASQMGTTPGASALSFIRPPPGRLYPPPPGGPGGSPPPPLDYPPPSGYPPSGYPPPPPSSPPPYPPPQGYPPPPPSSPPPYPPPQGYPPPPPPPTDDTGPPG